MEGLAKFFTGVGGVLTGLAAVIGGIGALYLAFNDGGGGQSSNGSSPSVVVVDGTTQDQGPTLEEWSSRANDICQADSRKLRQLGQPTTPDEVVVWALQALPISIASNNQIRALDRPVAQKRQIDLLLANLDDETRAVERAVQAARAGNSASFQSASQDAADLADRGVRMFADLGAGTCAEPLF